MPEWVMKVAQAIKDEWTIGTYSHFCDEVDFDNASVEEIAKLIWREYQAAQHSVQRTCSLCGGKKKMLDAAGYPVNCPACGGSGTSR